MARCYSAAMRSRHPFRHTAPLPRIWLLSDARNDAVLERALRRLPRGSGVILRHYHLLPAARVARLAQLTRIARACGHTVVLAGTMAQARQIGADGAYGSAATLARGPAGLRLATVHSLHEIGQAMRADAVLLSPVFATRSHPAGPVLGPMRFRLLAARATRPVIALGGMDAHRAVGLGAASWAGIDAFLR